jgi:D-hexose-6-phosphate mutarotase
MKEPGFENVPFHGFANRVLWKHEKSSESSEAVFSKELSGLRKTKQAKIRTFWCVALVPDEAIKKMFKQDFKLTYTVKVTVIRPFLARPG